MKNCYDLPKKMMCFWFHVPGSLNRDDILEFLLSSVERSVQTANNQEDASHDTPDPEGDTKQVGR